MHGSQRCFHQACTTSSGVRLAFSDVFTAECNKKYQIFSSYKRRIVCRTVMIKVVVFFCIYSDLIRATLINSSSILVLVSLVLHAQPFVNSQTRCFEPRLKDFASSAGFAQAGFCSAGF
ncbi:hypothetical protein CW304_14485 [Bacillus sp. UFRGS-B20]|nr:hypothetical protein CW304_14485 [Bacillus sp. UFRGS-B20]